MSDLRFLLIQKESLIQELENDLNNLKFKQEALISKNVKGLDTPLPPKIYSNSKFSQKELPSIANRDHQVNSDWANELRIADEKCKSLKNKLDEQLIYNKTVEEDLTNAKKMVENRDIEVKRLSIL